MDFNSCVELLAARPADAHAHCDHAQHEEEKLEHEQQQPLGESESAEDVAAGGDHVDDANLSARELVRSFFRLQEQRVQIYADFQKCEAPGELLPSRCRL